MKSTCIFWSERVLERLTMSPSWDFIFYFCYCSTLAFHCLRSTQATKKFFLKNARPILIPQRAFQHTGCCSDKNNILLHTSRCSCSIILQEPTSEHGYTRTSHPVSEDLMATRNGNKHSGRTQQHKKEA